MLGEASRLDARIFGPVFDRVAKSTSDSGGSSTSFATGNFDWGNWINSRLTISSSTQLIPMLKTCPNFLRGQFRQCFQVAAKKISCKLRRRCKSSARLEIVCLGADDDVADQVAMDLLEEVSWSTERTGGRSWFTMPHNTNSRKVHRSECSKDEECERRGKAT